MRPTDQAVEAKVVCAGRDAVGERAAPLRALACLGVSIGRGGGGAAALDPPPREQLGERERDSRALVEREREARTDRSWLWATRAGQRRAGVAVAPAPVA